MFVGAVWVLALLWRRGGVAKKVAWTGVAMLALFVGLAVYSTLRYVDLEEGVVMDACNGRAAVLEQRLRGGGNPNAKTDEGLGALDCATTNGHVETARILLEHGADPDSPPDGYRGPFNKTPREWAAEGKDPAMIRLFRRFPKRKGP